MSELAKETHRLLKKYHLRPNKRLGQNFLISEKIVAQIIEAADLHVDDEVCEIGCGMGLMTRQIGERVKRVVAVELDRGLAAVTGEVCRDCPSVSIIQEDVLEMERPSVGGKVFKVIGNLPYYATSHILGRLVEWKREGGFPLSRAIVMVQREVADRMVALPGNKVYGSFSVFMQFWTEMERVCQVPSGAFFPAPEVGSSVLAITFRDRPAVPVANADRFFKVVKSAFGQRRKMLRQSLKEIAPVEKLEAAFRKSGVDPKARPEQLGLEALARLVNAL